jgi:hypothetical protein
MRVFVLDKNSHLKFHYISLAFLVRKKDPKQNFLEITRQRNKHSMTRNLMFLRFFTTRVAIMHVTRFKLELFLVAHKGEHFSVLKLLISDKMLPEWPWISSLGLGHQHSTTIWNFSKIKMNLGIPSNKLHVKQRAFEKKWNWLLVRIKKIWRLSKPSR